VHTGKSGHGHGLLRRSIGRDTSIGQSLVEFSLVIPLILLLTLIAIDFGRVYLGWINLQNMSRIAANYAANDPDAWDGTPDAPSQERYRNQILGDAAATNCNLPEVNGDEVVPDPTFTDITGNGIGLGDTVTVQITCQFNVITPIISNLIGGTIDVTAEANFPVKSGLSALVIPDDPGGGGGGGVAPTAAFSANNVFTPDTISGSAPFAVEFRDTSGGAPSTWFWDFDDGTTSSLQDPLLHTFACATASCIFDVQLTVSNGSGSDIETMTVTVFGTTVVDFTSSGQSGTAPYTVTFTDASTAGATAWSWSFGNGNTGSGSVVNHTYNSTGSPYTVTLTVTYPSGPQSITKTAYITVGVGNCTVPSLNGVRFNSALGVWQGVPSNFTGTVIRGPGAPGGNFIITAQSLTATSLAPCNSSITVNRP